MLTYAQMINEFMNNHQRMFKLIEGAISENFELGGESVNIDFSAQEGAYSRGDGGILSVELPKDHLQKRSSYIKAIQYCGFVVNPDEETSTRIKIHLEPRK